MLFVCFVLFATIGGLEYICASLLIEEIADAWLSHLCEHGGDVIAVDGHKVLIRAVLIRTSYALNVARVLSALPTKFLRYLFVLSMISLKYLL